MTAILLLVENNYDISLFPKFLNHKLKIRIDTKKTRLHYLLSIEEENKDYIKILNGVNCTGIVDVEGDVI